MPTWKYLGLEGKLKVRQNASDCVFEIPEEVIAVSEDFKEGCELYVSLINVDGRKALLISPMDGRK